MFIAMKILNQLAWLAKDAATVEIQVHRATPEVHSLFVALGALHPGAWRPYGLADHEGFGWATATLVMPGADHRLASYTVHHLPQPVGWQPLEEGQYAHAEACKAGLELCAMACSSVAQALEQVVALEAQRTGAAN